MRSGTFMSEALRPGSNKARSLVVDSPIGNDAASQLKLFVSNTHSNSINCVAFRPSQDLIATASYDGTVKIWSADSGKLLRTLVGHLGWVSSLTWLDDDIIVTVS